ncbi:putative pentatricopeptide repeat-containing protein at3g49142 [Phtheirospermum japonicum]|uniref:Putative pentatricopeptide repeat-containing protein at3g49142 n=1 Tax=Phtheirospermum japonicum TaxID=374723 RepID=A0A830DPT1_9LAMI|nr:putative pentatricopeptide repeat-containing protein at3g49142 [Phtheirospermum japonicum]
MRAYAARGKPDITRKVFDEMPERNNVICNVMIRSYVNNPCSSLNNSRLGPQIHCSAVKKGLDSALFTGNGLIAMYGKCGNLVNARQVFDEMPVKDIVSWNSMVAGYSQNGRSSDAINLYTQMEARGPEPDAITIASVLPPCGDLSAVSLGKRIHEYIKKKKLCPNLSVENALIDMYAKCGCLKDARNVFDEMRVKDVISWTSMISAYGRSGKGREAMELFSEMRALGIVPDSIAFVSILSACSHAGLLDEGRNYYNIMTEKFKLVPRLEHFTCMVDLLGRAGRVDEAYNHIKNMPMEPNDRVWGALLSACHVYNNVDIGVIAADRLFELAPHQSGYYVLLSNIYAKAGRWKDVTLIRSIMKEKGVKKIPGVSNVEMGGRVHTFLAGDRSHPQTDEIYSELDVLLGRIKGIGYFPKIDSALHDVEEEEKENLLVVHSEKLAIVFAMINSEPGVQIRVTKNLRVCEDCHVAIKFISKVTEREIVVRDTNRYHHFENGVCSCGDYW